MIRSFGFPLAATITTDGALLTGTSSAAPQRLHSKLFLVSRTVASQRGCSDRFSTAEYVDIEPLNRQEGPDETATEPAGFHRPARAASIHDFPAIASSARNPILEDFGPSHARIHAVNLQQVEAAIVTLSWASRAVAQAC